MQVSVCNTLHRRESGESLSYETPEDVVSHLYPLPHEDEVHLQIYPFPDVVHVGYFGFVHGLSSHAVLQIPPTQLSLYSQSESDVQEAGLHIPESGVLFVPSV